MMLLIDDCPRRRRQFREAFGQHARTPEDRNAWAADLTYFRNFGALTDIYLDHDLSQDDGYTGETIARVIAERRIYTGVRVWLHSSNPTGSQKMYDILKDTHDVWQVCWDDVVKGGESDFASKVIERLHSFNDALTPAKEGNDEDKTMQ